MKIKEKLKFNLTIIILITIIVSVIYMFGGMRKYENTLSDFISTRFTDSTKASSNKIVFVLLSQKCLNEADKPPYNMGWPWKRTIYGKIVRYLKLSGAKLIVFTTLFSERSVYRDKLIDGYPIDDLEFAREIKEAGNVILPYAFNTSLAQIKKSIIRQTNDSQIENTINNVINGYKKAINSLVYAFSITLRAHPTIEI